MPECRVLVVGTTADYIAAIEQRYPGRALFLTDPAVRFAAAEPVPPAQTEILCGLDDATAVMVRLAEHLRRYDIELSGVMAYDCERMLLASHIAAQYGLPYPSADVIGQVRSKRRTKEAWTAAGIDCPRHALLYSQQDARTAVDQIGGPVVLKPLTGSGSELTFFCEDGYAAAQAYHTIHLGLTQRAATAMYANTDGAALDPALVCLAEEYVEGREYSCDMFIDGDSVQLIRVARKIPLAGSAFGVTAAYVVPARLPGWLTVESLSRQLAHAAHALGISRAICMVDFMVSKDRVRFLELTPRPGGDCLPPLIRAGSGLDMLGMALDAAEGATPTLPLPEAWTRLVGLRLFARRGGVIRRLNASAIERDTRVREIYLKRATGHRVVLPPDDYDSWQLGYVIFEPDETSDIDVQCDELARCLICKIQPFIDRKCSGHFYSGGSSNFALGA